MKQSALPGLVAACVALGTVVGVQGAQLDVSADLERLAERPVRLEGPTVALPAERDSPHEAIVSPGVARHSESTDKSPPAPIIERPGESAPSPDARWIEGYWDWDQARGEFHWVTGTWRTPPPGKFWVSGYWRRSENGWDRVPGFWSGRAATPTPSTSPIPTPTQTPIATASRAASPPRDWSRTGPPVERPEETPGPAPAPDYFYIPGDYVPRGEGVVWKQGFWHRSQHGWEWNPSRWVRQSTGWAFREGFWSRVANTQTPTTEEGPVLHDAAVISTSARTVTSSANHASANPSASVDAATPARDTPGPNSPARAQPGPPGPTMPIGAFGNRDAASTPRAATETPPDNVSRPGPTAVAGTPTEGVSPAPAPPWFTLGPLPPYPGMRRNVPPQRSPKRPLQSVIENLFRRRGRD
jgi:hypothetical protein